MDFGRGIDCLITSDRAALIARPIRKAEVIHADIAVSGSDRRGCGQSGPPATFAVGHDVIAGAESDALHHSSQSWRRSNSAIV